MKITTKFPADKKLPKSDMKFYFGGFGLVCSKIIAYIYKNSTCFYGKIYMKKPQFD